MWRDSTGRPMGLVKVEPIDLTCSSFERLTTYMTKSPRPHPPLAAEPRTEKAENSAPERHKMEPQAL